jgi:hypothetical protein
LKGLGRSDEATRKLIPGGYFGDPSGYDTEAARKYIEDYSKSVADTIESYMKGN